MKKRISGLLLLFLLLPALAFGSQYDMDISANDANTGVTFRSNLNLALKALVSQSSGASAPSMPYAYQLWADTSTSKLKIRNGTNDSWMDILDLTDGVVLSTDSAKSLKSNYTAAGTDTYTVSITEVTAYSAGDTYFIKFTNANTAIAPTLNISTLGAKTIKKEGGVALIAGDIPAGHAGILFYNGIDFILLNPAIPSTVPDLSITSAKIANDAITSAKIANDAITASEIAAAAVNSDELSQLAVAGKFVKSKAYKNTSQNVLNATWTKILLDAETFDVGGIMDTVNSKSMPGIAGYYLVAYQVTFNGNVSANTQYSRLYQNGSWIGSGMLDENTHSTGIGLFSTELIYCNGTTDYLELYAYQASGATQTVGNDSQGTYMIVLGPF